jgi:hypothetical protein
MNSHRSTLHSPLDCPNYLLPQWGVTALARTLPWVELCFCPAEAIGPLTLLRDSSMLAWGLFLAAMSVRQKRPELDPAGAIAAPAHDGPNAVDRY